ncbi:vault protein inter-alpha-trypsin [Marinomonas sp. SBI22]|uniref:VanZ family protein n=1 Tax=unclassified Marinomonas TaxID=196814 RepID=UPI0007AF32A4|nr:MULTISPECIES: VanZ family protein [unclassified Marinomonas]KZM42173.1 vault protein inter-alpha-trypsin [Marinomonas sp. SBI22]KZM46983.1 vault protein inter-alpha-trypsin [Marinomonas sp. SBI8L]
MQKLFLSITFLFIAFVLWVIFMANTGQDIWLFELTRKVPFGDKLGHFLVFGSLTLMANLATRGKLMRFKLGSIYWESLSVLIFVTLEELSQYFVATRTLDLLDYLANLLGILCFTGLSRELMRKTLFRNRVIN